MRAARESGKVKNPYAVVRGLDRDPHGRKNHLEKKRKKRLIYLSSPRRQKKTKLCDHPEKTWKEEGASYKCHEGYPE